MALKTRDDVMVVLGNTPGLTLVPSTLSEETRYTFSNGRTFAAFTNLRTSVPFTLSMTFASQRKYTKVTGKTYNDIKLDLLYHWLTGFEELASFTTLRSLIKDPATCGSFATTIGVNRYITTHNSSEEEIKELLSGSKWRWKKTEYGMYIQRTLWDDYTPEYSLFYAENVSLFRNGSSCAHVISGQDYIRNRARAIEEERLRVEAERLCVEAEAQARRDAQATQLQGYNTRATEFFKFKKGKDAHYSTFLGVELELEGHSAREFASLNSLKDHAIFKRDGSLVNGVEICSAPATLDLHKEAFKKFFEQMESNGSNLSAQSTCGMHVHIDKSKLSTLHIANLCLLLNNENNEDAIRSIAGRSANSYCKKVNHSYMDFTSGSRGDRYQRVNMTNERTIELRMFASTTNYQDFSKRLEFTQAVVDYTRPGATAVSCKDIPKWDNFKAYILKHRKAYPTLVKAI